MNVTLCHVWFVFQERKLKLLVEHEAEETKELESKCEVELLDWRDQLSAKKQVNVADGNIS